MAKTLTQAEDDDPYADCYDPVQTAALDGDAIVAWLRADLARRQQAAHDRRLGWLVALIGLMLGAVGALVALP